MVAEMFAEIAHEITADPTKFAVELVQFGIFVLLIKAVGFGFGKRKGMLTNMWARRLERLEARVEEASHAESSLGEARDRAKVRVAEARSAAARILLDARAEARTTLESSRATSAEESRALLARTEETLATELEEMHVEVRDKLVDLVAGATRSILSETYAASEQRALIQKAIIKGLDKIDTEDKRRAVRRRETVKGGAPA